MRREAPDDLACPAERLEEESSLRQRVSISAIRPTKSKNDISLSHENDVDEPHKWLVEIPEPIWSTCRFWYQFKDLELEKEYCAKIQAETSEKIHGSGAFEILFLLCFILLLCNLGIDIHAVGLRFPSEELLRLSFVLIYGISSMLVGRKFPRGMSEYAVLYPLVMAWPLIGLINPTRQWSSSLETNPMVTLIGGDLTLAMSVFDFFHIGGAMSIHVIFLCIFAIRSKVMVPCAVLLGLCGFSRLPFADWTTGQRVVVNATWYTLLLVLLIVIPFAGLRTDRKERTIFWYATETRNQADTVTRMFGTGFPGLLRISDGAIVATKGVDDLLEAPVTCLEDLPMQRAREGVESTLGLRTLVDHVLACGRMTEHKLRIQPRGGVHKGKKVFECDVIIARGVDMKTITIGIRVTDAYFQDNELPAEVPIQPLGFFVNQVDAHSDNIHGLETRQTPTSSSIASQSRFVQPMIRHGAIDSSSQAQGGTQEPCDADSKIDTKTRRTFSSASSARFSHYFAVQISLKPDPKISPNFAGTAENPT